MMVIFMDFSSAGHNIFRKFRCIDGEKFRFPDAAQYHQGDLLSPPLFIMHNLGNESSAGTAMDVGRDSLWSTRIMRLAVPFP